MRLILLAITTVSLLVPRCVFAQSKWINYVSKADYFNIKFPGQPMVKEITYPTEYRIVLPGRVYTFDDGADHYSVTVIDYRNALSIHSAASQACKVAGGDGDSCQDDGRTEMRGAMVYASWRFIHTEGATVTHFAMYNTDRIEGLEINLINADRSRTFAVIHMHENRLYVVEATVPANAPAPTAFRISLQFLDSEWKPVRYEWQGIQLYSNGFPPPPRVAVEDFDEPSGEQ